MIYLSEIFGLITKHDSTSENAGLFLAHYFTLKLILGVPILDDEKKIFLQKMENAKVSEGLYRRSKHHTERTVSHDEISGMLISSHVLKTDHGNSILNYLETNFLNYPATGVNKFYQPSNFYAWGLLTGRKWTGIFYPLYAISFFISIKKDKSQTSSKLIYFNELYHMRKLSKPSDLLWKIFKKEMENQYGKDWINGLFEIYFKLEENDFPLKALSKGINYDHLDN